MKKEILFFMFIFEMSTLGWGQIAAWDFTGVGSTSLPAFAATTFNSGLISASGANNITRGATAPWSTANNSFRTTGFKNEGISTSNTDYFQITLTASAGYVLSLSSIYARFAGTASYCVSPGVSSQFAYSLDGSTFILVGSPQATIGTPATMTQIDLTGIGSLQNVAAGTTVTLRYYASGQTATGGWGLYSASAGTNGLAIGGDLFSVSTFAGTGNWSSAGNWNNGIPTSTTNAIIDGAATIDNSAEARDLTILSGRSVTINATGSLSVRGNTFLNGNECLILKSDPSGTASFIDQGISGTGTAKVERYLTPEAWHYTSSPISDATANVFNGDYLKTSDPASPTGWSGWIVDPATPLQVMRGYACWKPTSNPALESFTGTLNTGTNTITLNRNVNDPWAGWHLVGNPYPGTIDLTKGITWDHFEATAYFWNGSVYLAYPATGGFGTHSPYAPAEQGFYVHINGSYEGNSTLTMTNTARVLNAETFLKDGPVIKNALLIEARGSNNAYTDKASVHFEPASTAGYDPGYDAYKLGGLGDAPGLYTRTGDISLTCNSLPFDKKNMVIPMGFSCGLAGTYLLTADSLVTFDNDISISLEDLKLNSSQDLKTNPVYNFIYNTSDDPNRFILHFDKSTFGVSDQKNMRPVQIYSFGSSIYIKSMDEDFRDGKVSVYDFIGKEVFNVTLSDQTLNRMIPNVAGGYYLVRIVTGKGIYFGKVFLK